MNQSPGRPDTAKLQNNAPFILISIVTVAALFYLGAKDFLLFHTMAEVFSIVVGLGIFALALNARRYTSNDFFVVLGLAYLFTGFIDLAHTVTYKGMNFIPLHLQADTATRLWIAARFLQAVSFIIAPFFVNKKVKAGYLVAGYVLFDLLMLGLVYTGLFPVCYVEGKGLTVFKEASEVVICALFIASIFNLKKKSEYFDKNVIKLLLMSITFAVLSEMCFALYKDLYGFFNIIGHLLKIVSTYVLYKAVLEIGFRRPYDLLFLDLKKREEELKKERDLANKYLDTSADILVMIDAEQKIMMLNRKGRELLGYTQEEIIGMNWYDNFVPARLRDEVKEVARRLMNGELEPLEYFENSIVNRQGEERLIAWHNNVFRDDSGRITATLSSGHDITERRRTAEALQESEERFKFIATNTPDHILVQDAALRYVWVLNPQLGLTLSDMIGKTDQEILSREDADAITGIKRKVMETGKAEYQLLPLLSKDGQKHYFEGSYVPRRDGRGNINGIIGYFKNITERVKMEEELSRSNKLLDAVTSGAEFIISALDTNYRYIFFNQAYKDEIRRLTGKELRLGMSLDELFADMPEERDAAAAAWKKKFESENFSNVVEFGDPKRHRRVYSVRQTPIRDIKGNVIGAGEIAYDITDKQKAEEALRQSEQKYRTLFNSMTEGFALHEIICDDNGKPVDFRFLEINPAFESLTGLKRENIVGKTHNEVLPSDDPIWVKRYGEVALEGKPAQFESFSPPLGKHYQVYAYGPAPKQFAVLFMDITERKKAEVAIRDLAKFPEQNPNPVLKISGEFILLYANEHSSCFVDLWHCPVGNAVPKDIQEIVADCLNSGSNRKVELACAGKVFSFIFSPVTESSRYVNVYGNDITDRKRTEKELIETRDYLESLFNYANAPIICWDPQFRITRFNRAFENLSGYSSAEVLGRELSMLFPDGSRGQSAEKIRQTLAGEKWDIVEIPVKRRDGGIRLVLWNSANIYTQDGSALLATIAQGQDITERKQAEEIMKRDKETFAKLVEQRTKELLSTKTELENAKRLSDIGTLAATVAHELRNPLGVIRTAVYNIKRKANNELLNSHIVNIEKKISESNQIINNLLDYSRIKAPNYEKVKIYYILDECINSTRERYDRKEIKFNSDMESIKDSYFDLDPFQMREVFNNILDNACQAVGAKDARIEVKVTGAGSGKLEIVFSDNGQGIEEQDMEKIFEPFFTRKSKGTGLGLTICNELVNLHNGGIGVRSAPGKGTEVTVTIPERRQ